LTVHFDDRSSLKLYRQDGHYFITVRAVHRGGELEGTRINFIFDTGAFISVISRKTAVLCGFDKLPKKPAELRGFTGAEPADFVVIPGLRLLDNLITDVPVLIPKDSTSDHEVLGLNVLEYFKYYVDTENDRLYLCLNPNPKPYDGTLSCGQIFSVDAGGKIHK